MITETNKKLNKQINHNIPSALVPYCHSALLSKSRYNMPKAFVPAG